jgi:hypothetical protein
MAYYSAKDVTAFTYNSQDLKAFIAGGFELSDEGVISEWRAPGSAYKTRKHTGQYDCPDFTVKFMYDGTATGPAVKCARGTSATLTASLATGLSITGTFIVKSWGFAEPEEGDATLDVTFTSDGDVTWDLAA